MLGSGRLSGDNHNHKNISRVGSTEPISMSGNTRHEDHWCDLTKVGRGG